MRLLDIALAACLAATPAVAAEQQTARQILDATGTRGGLVVHVGCGGGKLTAALRANDAYRVHGLAVDTSVSAARQHVKSLGLYGPISVESWSGGRLPYIDNSVNLIVLESGGVSVGEAMRVLVPGGAIWDCANGGRVKAKKPWPTTIDQWTHYLHDPSNNAVAQDSEIEPPRRYQWIAGPRYSRQHDHMSSVSAVVSANGRLFYIFDEAHRASILTPPRWRLIARDAFNGTFLWKREIDVWHPHLWRLKSGPQLLARRLVAVGDRLYVTLGIDAPLSVLDAATGETIRTCDETKATEEILCSDGTLFLSVAADGQPLRSDPARRYRTQADLSKDATNPLWTEAPRTIMAVDADSGAVRWKKTSRLVSLSLAVDAKQVVFHDGERIRSLDRQTGKPLWRSAPMPRKAGMKSSGGATLVLYEDVVLYSGQVASAAQQRAAKQQAAQQGAKQRGAKKRGAKQAKKRVRGTELQRATTMFALSAKDGTTLWQSHHHPCGHQGTPDDLLVAGGLVWNGAVAQGTDSGTMTGRDVRTGEIVREFTPDVDTHWFHHRCYRAKATEKYLLFFMLIERTAFDFCATTKRAERDEELRRLYQQLRRRPAALDDNPLFSYLQAAARLYMSLRDVSRAEFEAVAQRLSRSARRYADGPGSRNYIRLLSQHLG